jgi:hypothetical protein
MSDPITSARVRELSAKATGGDWRIAKQRTEIEIDPDSALNHNSIWGGPFDHPIVAKASFRPKKHDDPWVDACSIEPANAALIAALCSEPARAHIAKALDLLERVEAGDAGLVEAMAEAAYNADVGACEAIEARMRAALAALVGEGCK